MRKKLRSQRGIAMIFAIVAFVVVMVLGTVVYTAGYANYSKLFGRKNSRQTYYVMTSAARLLKDELEGAQITVEETWTDTNADGVLDENDDGPAQTISYMPSSGLAEQILTRLAEHSDKIESDVTVERGSYKTVIELEMDNVDLDHELDSSSSLIGTTRETALKLKWPSDDETDKRMIVMQVFLTPDYLMNETGMDASGAPVSVSQTKYTMTIGEIHEED